MNLNLEYKLCFFVICNAGMLAKKIVNLKNIYIKRGNINNAASITIISFRLNFRFIVDENIVHFTL